MQMGLVGGSLTSEEHRLHGESLARLLAVQDHGMPSVYWQLQLCIAACESRQNKV